MLWTQNNSDIPGSYNWARWYPELSPGVYEVNVYIPERFSTTSQARYWVSHTNGYTMRVIDQTAYASQWVSLGTFEFDGSRSDYLSLADVTFEIDISRQVAYDAVRWLPATPAGQGTATVTPAVVSNGTFVTVSARDFPPGQSLYLRMGPPHTEPFGQYGQAIVAEDGTATFEFIMPATWPGGEAIADTLTASNQLVLLLTSESGMQATTTVTFQP
jgi:hypothetical protein